MYVGRRPNCSAIELRLVWMHFMYGGICGILGKLLSSILTVMDKMFWRLFVKRARWDCTYASKIFVFAVL